MTLATQLSVFAIVLFGAELEAVSDYVAMGNVGQNPDAEDLAARLTAELADAVSVSIRFETFDVHV